MPCTVNVNKLTVVHKGSGGMVSFMPDVCLTPAPPAPPVPIPYPNIAMSADTDQGSKDVKVDGNPIMLQGSVFSKSTGDEAGTNGGLVSGVTKGKAEFIAYSFDVQVEGKCVPRLSDMMLGNKGGTFNTPPMAEVQAPLPMVPMPAADPKPDKLVATLVDMAGNPVADMKYVLLLQDGTKKEGKTDSAGKIKAEDLMSGVGKITFPEAEGATSKKPG